MNTIILTGRLVKDIEEQTGSSGKSYNRNCLAVDRQGNGTDFIDIVAFGKTSELMAKYLAKGSRVGVEGRLQTDTYADGNGAKKKTYAVLVNRIEFLSSKSEDKRQRAKEEGIPSEMMNKINSSVPADFVEVQDEDLPF